MKALSASFLCLALLGFSFAHAQDDPRLSALKAADDARVAAMKAPDREQLNAIFSDDLHYAHASGTVDTKASFMEVLVSGHTKYVILDYEERNFTFPAPHIALMTGRADVKAVTATGGLDSTLGFLAVWREENGKWRFLAWQSCKLPATKTP